METLRALAHSVDVGTVRLPSGQIVEISRWAVRFPEFTSPHTWPPSLGKTYTNKPLVDVDGEPLFGELAILRYLQKDGWDGVWVDTFHSRGRGKLCWTGLPGRTEPFDLTSAPEANALYDRIVSINGKASGFFDVFVWRGEKFLFLEYKGKGDRPNRNESRWIESALKAGVSSSDLVIVVY